MKRIGYIMPLIAALMLMYGCQEEEKDVSATARLVLNTSIGSSSQTGTRSAYSGTKFTTNRTMGMYICVHEEGTPSQFAPHQLGYGNLRVTCTNNTGDSWSYYNRTLDATFPNLYLTTRNDDATADVYAYTPYMVTATDLNAIDMDFSSNCDYMWAEQNGVSNKGLDPIGKTEVPVTLNFRHILSRLRIGVILEYAGSNHLMEYITLLKSGSKTTPIYKTGKFSAMNGSVSDLVEADSVRITYDSGENNGYFSNASDYTYIDFLINPTDFAADNDLTLVMCIDGFRYQYVIKKADVLHSDGTTYGFKRGYSYDFHFKLDNYVHLKDITIQDWIEDKIEDVL